jgi:hypothetical protein
MTTELALRLYFFLNFSITWIFWTTGGAGDTEGFKKHDYIIMTTFGCLFGFPAMFMGLFIFIASRYEDWQKKKK